MRGKPSEFAIRHARADTGLAEPWYFAERCALEVERGLALAFLVVETAPARDVTVGEWLPKGLRRGDVITHFGGGRYAILLPGAGAYDAGRVAARIRTRSAKIDIGVAIFPQDGSDMSELVVAAIKQIPGPFAERSA